MSLLDDLHAAKDASEGKTQCAVCVHLKGMDPGEERSTLATAFKGTIGLNKLVRICRAHNIPVGRRSIERHRKEGHK